MADDDNILCQKLYWWYFTVKFIYSEKATKFCEISTLFLSYVVQIKSKVEISQNFVAFSECMNFTRACSPPCKHSTKKSNSQASAVLYFFAYYYQTPWISCRITCSCLWSKILLRPEAVNWFYPQCVGWNFEITCDIASSPPTYISRP